MKQYIDKAAVVAEIERKIEAHKETLKNCDSSISEMVLKSSISAYQSLLYFLDTLEVKEEPESVDLANAAIEYCGGNKGSDARVRAAFVVGANWQHKQMIMCMKHGLLGLKKQGEKKYIPKYKIGDYVKNTNYKGEPIYEIVYMDKECYICEYRGKERMGDKAVMHFSFDNPYLRLVQKPTDKVEPKFHKGEWIISNNKKSIYQVIEVERGIYVIRDNVVNHEYHIVIEECERSGRLWNISDAKDGDVLAFYGEYKDNKMLQVGIIERYVGKHGGCSNTFKIYVGVNWENNLQIGEYMGCSDIRPATKEQRDTLMKAMADAGYTFDFEERKLKKIEQKQVIDYPNNLSKDNCELIHEFVEKLGRIPKEKDELDLLVEYVLKRKKSTWSEEDEEHIDSLLKRLDGLCRNEFERTRFAINEDKDWLKSLKQRIGG